MIRRFALLFALLLACGGASAAVDPDELLRDPAQEARARTLTRQLRCLVCQNQSIDDSNAPLARDLRRLVRERIAKGESDAEVMAYIVARYGDFVLLRPPVKASTYLLWFGPVVGFAAGGIFLWRRARRRAALPAAEPAPLTEAEKSQLAAALEGKPAPAAERAP